MTPKDITLTPAELEEIKDEARFREKVVLELKLMRGIPDKVNTLEVWSKVQWGAIFFVVLAIIGKAIRLW